MMHFLSIVGLAVLLVFLIMMFVITRDINIFVYILFVALILSLVYINLKIEMKKT